MKQPADTADEQTETTLYLSSAKPQYLVPVHFAEVFGANVQWRFWSPAKDAWIPANILLNPKRFITIYDKFTILYNML